MGAGEGRGGSLTSHTFTSATCAGLFFPEVTCPEGTDTEAEV